MAIFDFLRKKQVTNQEPPCDADNKKILEQLAELTNITYRVEKKQKEMIHQLEEIDEAIHEGAEGLHSSIMNIADIVYDFYYFTQNDTAVNPQAQMMWTSTKENLSDMGIIVLEPMGESFNYNLHIAHSMVADADLPNEYITEILKCGYIYEEKILRRAMVTVNKLARKED